MKTKQSCNRLAEACLAARGPAQKLESQGWKYLQQTRRRLHREEQNTDNGNIIKTKQMRKQLMLQYGMRLLGHIKAGMKSRQLIMVQVICVTNKLNVV